LASHSFTSLSHTALSHIIHIALFHFFVSLLHFVDSSPQLSRQEELIGIRQERFLDRQKLHELLKRLSESGVPIGSNSYPPAFFEHESIETEYRAGAVDDTAFDEGHLFTFEIRLPNRSLHLPVRACDDPMALAAKFSADNDLETPNPLHLHIAQAKRQFLASVQGELGVSGW
jgi:hypothetical protein